MAVSATVALAAALGAAGCGGCKEKAKSAPASPEAERPARDRPAGDRPAAPDRRRAPVPRVDRPVRRNAPLTVDDAIAALPAFASGTDLAPPATAPSGMQVRFTRCVSAQSVVEAGTAVKSSIEGSGWSKLAVRPPEGAQSVPRYGIAAQKDDLRLSVTIRAVRRSGCDETLGQYFAVATMNRIGDADDPGATGSPAPPPENE